jgi:magnesium-transporting ATPase (P-type)
VPPYRESLLEALNEKILAVIAIFAVLSIITGMIYTPSTGWIEGTSIIIALFLLVVITSLNDWSKDKAFVNLQGLARDEDVSTVRGKKGSVSSIKNWDLVVGDVIYLSSGDKVPADCVLIDCNNLIADQCSLAYLDQEFRADVPKGEETDPFLYADSYIQVGSCRAMVAAVGRHTLRGEKDKKHDTKSKTPLELKLFNLSKTFTFIGIIAALVILATQLIMLALGTGFSDSDSKGAMFVKKLIESLTLALIVIIVSIPEGLPMAV